MFRCIIDLSLFAYFSWLCFIVATFGDNIMNLNDHTAKKNHSRQIYSSKWFLQNAFREKVVTIMQYFIILKCGKFMLFSILALIRIETLKKIFQSSQNAQKFEKHFLTIFYFILSVSKDYKNGVKFIKSPPGRRFRESHQELYPYPRRCREESQLRS